MQTRSLSVGVVGANSCLKLIAKELLVALATCALIREVHPPLQGEEGPSVVQAEEMYQRDERHGQEVLVPVGAPRPSPLLQGVMELLGIPAELTLDQQVDSGRMMPESMLQGACLEKLKQQPDCHQS